MNDPSLVFAAHSPLLNCLEQCFVPEALKPWLGEEAAFASQPFWDAALREPLVDFLERPSKEFRGTLLLASYQLAGGQATCPAALPWVVEALHAGSLIVDDIQDQSPARRGRPALHCTYGLPVALNAGNFLYFWALSLLEKLELEPSVELASHRWIARQLMACHQGQALDLTLRIGELEQSAVAPLVLASTRLKTGALMELSAALGALAAKAPATHTSALAHFGAELGVALQMLDDVGGLVSEKRCHKGHEDLLLGRPTWPWAWLAADLSKERYTELRRLAQQVAQRDVHPEVLSRALRKELQGSGRVRARRALQQALLPLRELFGAHPTLNLIESEVRRLEHSYV